jgi:hypothetical protein
MCGFGCALIVVEIFAVQESMLFCCCCLLQARQADVRSHLDEVWPVEGIPHPTKDMMSGETRRKQRLTSHM